jgi:hypothetical protein
VSPVTSSRQYPTFAAALLTASRYFSRVVPLLYTTLLSEDCFSGIFHHPATTSSPLSTIIPSFQPAACNYCYNTVGNTEMSNNQGHHQPGLDRYIVIHVATTCDEHGVYVTKDSAEVIELGWILLNAKNLEEVMRTIFSTMSKVSVGKYFQFTILTIYINRSIVRAFLSNLSTRPSLLYVVSAFQFETSILPLGRVPEACFLEVHETTLIYWFSQPA